MGGGVTATALDPVAVTGWGNDRAWLAARRNGISASDVAAVLGFSEYATPWEVWADKTRLRPHEVDATKEAIRLGVALEPWLLRQAGYMLDVEVRHTAHRLYAHPRAAWRLASPDGETVDGTLIEAKTSGIASGFGAPRGWTDTRVPLGYEFQCRWQMHVMDRERVELIALVAGLGLRRYTIFRDLALEADMIAQVGVWRTRHLIEGAEPAMGPSDNGLIIGAHPHATDEVVHLDDDPDIIDLLYAYRDGLDKEKSGKETKQAASAAIKRKLGTAAVATVGGHQVATWDNRDGSIRWQDIAAQLAERLADLGHPANLAALAEDHRNDPGRTLRVNGISS